MAITTWAAFTSIPNGTRIFNGGDECVAVANEYHLGVLGGSWVAIQSAHEWWTGFSGLPTLTSKYMQSQTPVAGAVVVWNQSAANGWHGQIGVVLATNSDGSFTTLEQNYGSGAQRWAYRYTHRKDSTLFGFLIPNNNPAPNSGDNMPLSNADVQRVAEATATIIRHHQRENGVSPNGSAGRTLFDLGQQSADGLTDKRAASIDHHLRNSFRENGFGWQNPANGRTIWEVLRSIESKA